MDPDQLQYILIYATFVCGASVVLQRAKPDWKRIRIAFVAGSLLPLLGVGMCVYALVRWMFAERPPGDIDHYAMAIVGILILLFLSLACLVVGFLISLLTTAIVRLR